jgi:hypothetical protein
MRRFEHVDILASFQYHQKSCTIDRKQNQSPLCDAAVTPDLSQASMHKLDAYWYVSELRLAENPVVLVLLYPLPLWSVR